MAWQRPMRRLSRRRWAWVAVDAAALTALDDLPQVTRSDRVHEREHSLEVQLPFLQTLLGSSPALERPGARPALAVAGHDMRARWWHPLHDGRNCQNWGISKGREMDHLTDAASPERIAEAARASGALSVVLACNAAAASAGGSFRYGWWPSAPRPHRPRQRPRR